MESTRVFTLNAQPSDVRLRANSSDLADCELNEDRALILPTASLTPLRLAEARQTMRWHSCCRPGRCQSKDAAAHVIASNALRACACLSPAGALPTTAGYSETRWDNGFRTAHPDVCAAISEASAATRKVLGANLLSLGLSGSLAIGDFDPSSSDIDLIAIVASDLTDEEQAVLQHTYNTIRATNRNWWTTRIEIAYLPLRACRHIETQPQRHYMLCVDGELRLSQPRTDWVVQKHILREFGPVLTGAAPRMLIAAADGSQLQATATPAAVPFITSTPPGTLPEKTLALHVLSMCRVLYTRHKGDVASKAAAADWAKSIGPSGWHLIIDAALHGRAGTQPAPTAAAYSVIREMASSLTIEGES